jgi:hypothetical protein
MLRLAPGARLAARLALVAIVGTGGCGRRETVIVNNEAATRGPPPARVSAPPAPAVKPAPASTAPSVEAQPLADESKPRGNADASQLSGCAAPFPMVRLDELARDGRSVRPWGRVVVDAPRRTAVELPATRAPGDPDAIAAAWGFALPLAYADFIRRFDGADVGGAGGHIEVWSTRLATKLATDSARPFENTRTRHFVSIGTDGGDWELFIDVDDYFGMGRCAVLFADEASEDVFFLAKSFPAAIDRVVGGPAFQYEGSLARRRPPK